MAKFEYSSSDFITQCLLAYNEAVLIDVYRDKKTKNIHVDFECDFDPEEIIEDFNNNRIQVYLKDWLETSKQVQSYINKRLQHGG